MSNAVECSAGEIKCLTLVSEDGKDYFESFKECVDGHWGPKQTELGNAKCSGENSTATVYCDPKVYHKVCQNKNAVEVYCDESGIVKKKTCIVQSCRHSSNRCIPPEEAENYVMTGGTPGVSRCSASMYKESCGDGYALKCDADSFIVKKNTCGVSSSCYLYNRMAQCKGNFSCGAKTYVACPYNSDEVIVCQNTQKTSVSCEGKDCGSLVGNYPTVCIDNDSTVVNSYCILEKYVPKCVVENGVSVGYFCEPLYTGYGIIVRTPCGTKTCSVEVGPEPWSHPHGEIFCK